MANRPIRIQLQPDLLRVLTALGIQWNRAISGNGEGDWALVEMDDADDERLLQVWNHLTTLRLIYIEAMRYNQLPLWEEGGADG